MAQLAADRCEKALGLKLLGYRKDPAGDSLMLKCGVALQWAEYTDLGETELSLSGLQRLSRKSLSFAKKGQGMMQFRSHDQRLQITLSAKRSKWTTRLRKDFDTQVDSDANNPEMAAKRLYVDIVMRHEKAKSGGTGMVRRELTFSTSYAELNEFALGLARECGRVPSAHRN